MTPCRIPGCNRTDRIVRGMCQMHYGRWLRHGDPLVRRRAFSAVERLDRYVEKQENGCWIWTAALNNHGYGTTVGVDKRHAYAHRLSYELHVGPIPDGMSLDHLCRTPACVNPDHLEPVTQRENVLRGRGPFARNAAKTHCIRGHAYTPENTYYRRDRIGRMCRECNRLRDRRRSA